MGRPHEWHQVATVTHPTRERHALWKCDWCGRTTRTYVAAPPANDWGGCEGTLGRTRPAPKTKRGD